MVDAKLDPTTNEPDEQPNASSQKRDALVEAQEDAARAREEDGGYQ